MPTPTPAESQLVLQTRAAIVGAFVELVLERRYEAIRIADLVTAARVGRATFYEHFGGKSDVLLTAIKPVLLALSTAASGRAARLYVRDMVGHLWDRRSMARTILGSATTPIVQRRLADMIRLQIDRVNPTGIAPSIRATGIAAAQIAMLRSWLSGETSCTLDEVTDQMIECSKLVV
ncbi:MAG: TetR/AcrR family transcriptional regulator [Sphingomicrobium sp.]